MLRGSTEMFQESERIWSPWGENRGGKKKREEEILTFIKGERSP